jgi:NADPH-dependent 2,4-dienoyl-CoA reductase/sulfur reductase-like enzyme
VSEQRVVIVGGGPAALAAIRGYREAGGTGELTMLTPEPHLPYLRPPLSKTFLRGEMEQDALFLESADFYAAQNVTVRLGTAAERLDAGARTVAPHAAQALDFDACILATGSAPTPLPVPGADHDDVLYLRSLESALKLRARVHPARSALVVGSGFIGCEAAASMAMQGRKVTMVTQEAVPHAQRLGPEVGERIQAWLEELEIELFVSAEVAGIEDGRRLLLASGTALEADLVLVAGGVTPQIALAGEAGLATENRRVVVDEQMRTSAAGVFAAGDIAFAHNAAAGRHLAVEHWVEAKTMGAIAGRAAAGDAEARWAQGPGFFSTIGRRTIKQVAWGDGFDEVRLIEHADGGWTAWYGTGGVTVGVLTHECDADYERGRELVEQGAPLP